MTDQELRDVVREAISRHLGHDAPGPRLLPPAQHHSSHEVFHIPSGGDGDGACLIEPSVRCNHCGYCLSYGH